MINCESEAKVNKGRAMVPLPLLCVPDKVWTWTRTRPEKQVKGYSSARDLQRVSSVCVFMFSTI